MNIGVNNQDIEICPLEGMQRDAARSKTTELMLGGQAGPGKSWFLLYDDLYDAFRFPELRVVILRDTSPQLADLIEKAHELYTPLGAKFKSQCSIYKKSVFEFPKYHLVLDENGEIVEADPIPGTTGQGAKFILGHCEHEKDKFKYSGFEFQRLKFDELTNFSESTYTFLFSRVRTTNPKIRTTVRATTNPVGRGMLWVRRRFVEKLKPYEVGWFTNRMTKDTRVDPSTPYAMSRQWIPGERSQNKHLDLNQYETQLGQLSEREYTALALGSWDIPEMPDQIVKPIWVSDALNGNTRKETHPKLIERWAFGCDHAQLGKDMATICGGQGNAVKYIRGWPTTTEIDFAWLIASAHSASGKADAPIGLDATGPGSGVATILESGVKSATIKEVEHMKGVEVDIPALGQHLTTFTEKDEDFDSRYRGVRRFGNMRAQMWWKLREDMRNRDIDLSQLIDPESLEDISTKLQEELLAVTYFVRNGYTYIVSKDELRKPDSLGRSTDYADALVMWNWVRTRNYFEGALDLMKEYDVDCYTKNFVKTVFSGASTGMVEETFF